MKILGNSYQEKEPTPTEPVEIKDNIIIVNINGGRIEIPIKKPLKEGDKFEKIDGEWHLIRRVPFKEEG